mmetsp:Transcript_14756/g.57897  ORF Transcript_14756/g.57897 Transcript_14756/m.57897 type:complete len:255 (-) Transcript_14756:371-1135(-)
MSLHQHKSSRAGCRPSSPDSQPERLRERHQARRICDGQLAVVPSDRVPRLRRQLYVPIGQDVSCQNLALEHRKPRAQTHPRPASERHVRVERIAALASLLETARPEPLHVLLVPTPVSSQPTEDVWGHPHPGALGNPDLSPRSLGEHSAGSLLRLAHDDEHRRVQPHRLLHRVVQLHQRVRVRHRARQPAPVFSPELVHLPGDGGPHLGVRREQAHHARHRRGGGIVTRHHHLRQGEVHVVTSERRAGGWVPRG